MSFIRQTSVTYGDAKTRIAEATGSTADSGRLTKAGAALQTAFRHWNNAANWKWLRTSTTINTVAGTANYTLPSLTKNVHSILVGSGSEARTLGYIDRRTFNNVIPNQDQSNRPLLYDLFTMESGQGVLRLFPTPSSVEALQVDYYRRMVLPCTVTAIADVADDSAVLIADTGSFKGATIGSRLSPSPYFINNQVVQSISSYTTITMSANGDAISPNITVTVGGEDILLDCPEEYVDGIIAWATHYYLINTAGSPRLEYWMNEAHVALDRALRENRSDTPDEDVLILPASAYDNTYLGTNDIRWADRGW